MTLRNRFKNPQVLIRTGLLFLILAGLSLKFLHPSANVSKSVTDGISGLLYGISISCLLLGIWLNARRRSGDDARPCA